MTKTAVQLIEVDAEHEGRRLDNFLLTKLKGVPKSFLYRLMRQGEIRVNKKRIKPDYRLQAEDVIRVAPIRMGEAVEPAKPSEKMLTQLNGRVLYEDEGCLILNKPVGLAVHGGSGIRVGAIELLRLMRPQEKFLELAHRLDRDTSGCLIIAKKRSILKELHELFREGGVHKKYYALTFGHWSKAVNLVRASLQKNVLNSGERRVRVSPEEGKASFTEFKVIKVFPQATLVEATLHTGRTHQIRVHAQFSGHPIAGDDKYGDRAFDRVMRQKGLRRLFLHAHHLQFVLPGSKKSISVEAPLDKELSDFLLKIG